MKLATYNDGSRDGQLVVVSRDLASAHFATGIATRLQSVLDDWNFLSPQLEDLYATLNGGQLRHAFAFDPRRAMAPLPRAYQWAAVDRDAPDTGPVWQRVASDAFAGPCDDEAFGSAEPGIDFGAGLAVVTGDVACGAGVEQALEGIRLVLLVNAWTLHDRLAVERAAGSAPVEGRPGTTFGPLAVTPDELGDAWHGGRVHLQIESVLNGRHFGRCDGTAGAGAGFGDLLAQLAAGRTLRAGRIVGTGTLRVGPKGTPAPGGACIAERRAYEAATLGAPQTGWLQFGDTVRLEATARDGASVFGAIEQKVVPRPA